MIRVSVLPGFLAAPDSGPCSLPWLWRKPLLVEVELGLLDFCTLSAQPLARLIRKRQVGCRMRGHAQPDGGPEEVGIQAGSWLEGQAGSGRRWLGVACWDPRVAGRIRQRAGQPCARGDQESTPVLSCLPWIPGRPALLLPPGLNACLCQSSGFFQPSAPVFFFFLINFIED